MEDFQIDANLFNVIKRRRSGRNYKPYSISINELSIILHFSYGITNELQIKDVAGIWSYRAVLSGGALYPLEIYFYLNEAALPKGIYSDYVVAISSYLYRKEFKKYYFNNDNKLEKDPLTEIIKNEYPFSLVWYLHVILWGGLAILIFYIKNFNF